MSVSVSRVLLQGGVVWEGIHLEQAINGVSWTGDNMYILPFYMEHTYACITQNMKAALLVAVIEPWQEQFKEGRVYYWLTVRMWSNLVVHHGRGRHEDRSVRQLTIQHSIQDPSQWSRASHIHGETSHLTPSYTCLEVCFHGNSKSHQGDNRD